MAGQDRPDLAAALAAVDDYNSIILRRMVPQFVAYIEQLEEVRRENAETLILIARDLRLSGDVPLTRFTDEGVETDPLTLAGWLELIAMQLDFAHCMTLARDYDPDTKGA